jgi:hypothetical protein
MSKRGMTDLLLMMMAAGGVAALDVRDHRQAHEAIRRLRDRLDQVGLTALAEFGIGVDWTPDPEVGLRVPGVTVALWDAAKSGALTVDETATPVAFVLSSAAALRSRRQLSKTPPEIARAIYEAGATWANASTSRKSDASSRVSSGRVRLSSRA